MVYRGRVVRSPPNQVPLLYTGLEITKKLELNVNISYPSILRYVLCAHLDGSSEYPQHIFLFRNKKSIFCYSLLT